MEFRQRAPRDRLDQDGPLSEERLLPKVPCWVGETEREPRAAPVQSPFSGTSAGVVNSSHGRFPSPGRGEARCLWVSHLSLQKDTSKNKDAGHPPTLQHPGSQTPGLSFSPPCSQSTHNFPCYRDLHQLYNILFQMLQPSTPINIDLNLVSTLHPDPHCLQHSVFSIPVAMPAPKFDSKPKCQYSMLFPV